MPRHRPPFGDENGYPTHEAPGTRIALLKGHEQHCIWWSCGLSSLLMVVGSPFFSVHGCWMLLRSQVKCAIPFTKGAVFIPGGLQLPTGVQLYTAEQNRRPGFGPWSTYPANWGSGLDLQPHGRFQSRDLFGTACQDCRPRKTRKVHHAWPCHSAVRHGSRKWLVVFGS